MFTLLDRAYSVVRSFRKRECFHSFDIEEAVYTGTDGKTLVAFLPNILMAGRYLGNQIIQGARHHGLGIIAREIPKTTIHSTPHDTKRAMDQVYHLVSERVGSYGLSPRNLIVLGESIGCCQASRFAAEFGTKRLILALPGSKLAECIFESHTTRGEAREAQRNGYSLQDYQKALRVYNPLSYVSQISGKVIIPLATHDIMIPTRRGRELLGAFEIASINRRDLHVTSLLYRYCDHTSGAFRFAREFETIIDSLLEPICGKDLNR